MLAEVECGAVIHYRLLSSVRPGTWTLDELWSLGWERINQDSALCHRLRHMAGCTTKPHPGRSLPLPSLSQGLPKIPSFPHSSHARPPKREQGRWCPAQPERGSCPGPASAQSPHWSPASSLPGLVHLLIVTGIDYKDGHNWGHSPKTRTQPACNLQSALCNLQPATGPGPASARTLPVPNATRGRSAAALALTGLSSQVWPALSLSSLSHSVWCRPLSSIHLTLLFLFLNLFLSSFSDNHALPLRRPRLLYLESA